MSSFLLGIDFFPLGRIDILENQCWYVNVSDNNFTDTFFDWLETKKYQRDASIKYSDDNVAASDLYAAGKYYKTLRFRFSEDESSRYYYQQRYHSTENEGVQTLKDYLGIIDDPYLRELAPRLGMDKLYDEKINMLSTGEFRKAVTLKASLSKPKVLFIDEPCTGLDATSCGLLNELFDHLVHNGTSVVIFSSSGLRPGFVTHVLETGNNRNKAAGFYSSDFDIPCPACDIDFDNAFNLENITASYNGRDVLHDVCWKVRRGQKWSLTGRNGAGKSTLLSFIYADNPQVYSNNVWLFDKKRGSGETIWEVKDRIGFYSSELHRYFNKMQTVESAINSIVYQNPYEKRVLTDGEENFKMQLTGYFGLDLKGHKLLYELPSTTQKLAILAAVLVKNAPLLILDEPFQGLSGKIAGKIVTLLERYVKDRTFIMVSHNRSDFPECVDNHFHMENGRGSEIGGYPPLKE
jgi:molybdate transport system ATP-binding protein